MDFIVRDATLDDSNDLNYLAYTLYDQHHINRPDIFKKQKNAFPVHLLKKLMDSETDHVIVACNEYGVVLGYAYFTFKTTKDSDLCYERKITEIIEICTHINHRGEGVATSLHNEIIRRAKHHNYLNLELDVWFFNTEAVAFYQKLGYLDKNKKMELMVNT